MATGQCLYRHESRLRDGHDDKLCDAIADSNFVRGVEVGVEKRDANLASISGIHRARRIDHRNTVFRSKAAPGHDESGKAVRQRDGHSRTDCCSLARSESDSF